MTILSLSKGVFEQCTSTGNGLFSFLDSGFPLFFVQIVAMIVKTLKNTNLVASMCFKMKKTLLPLDVRCSKTPYSGGTLYPLFLWDGRAPFLLFYLILRPYKSSYVY